MRSLRAERSWASLVIDDFLWLQLVMPSVFASCTSAREDLGSWFDYVLHKGSAWNKLLAKLQTPKNNGCAIGTPDINSIPESVATYVCSDCSNSFVSLSLLNTHRFQAHGKRSTVRSYADAENKCRCCLTSFTSRDATIKHLLYSHKCLNVLSALYTPLDDHILLELDNQAIIERHALRNTRVPLARAQKHYGPYLSTIAWSQRRPFAQ